MMTWNVVEQINYKELSNKYYHGDLDLIKLIKEIGKEEVQKIIDSI